MLTLQALLGVLPSARLAEADLPRFLTQALGRMTADELAGTGALLEMEQLVGFPRTLGTVMNAVIDVMLRDGIAPGALEPALVERLIATPAFLDDLQSALVLTPLVLRPGDVISSEVRELVGRHVRVLKGVGPHLTLVSPVQVLRLQDLGLSVVRSPVLARPMTAADAESVHDAWTTIEEATGWPSAAARDWEARFVRVASRTNLDAAGCAETLEALLPSRRRALWLALVAHHRMQELREAHRPGAAGLARRLDALSLDEQETNLVSGLAELASVAYASCGPSASTAAGDFLVTEEDLESYLSWIDHTEATRTILGGRSPEQIQRLLRLVTAMEAGTLQMSSDAEEVRAVRLFRDQYLVAVHARDVTALHGVDPLLLARAQLQAGHDRGQIILALQALAESAIEEREQQASDDAAQQSLVLAAEEAAPPEELVDNVGSPFSELVPRIPRRATTSPGLNPFASSEEAEQPHRVKTDSPPMELPPLPEVPRVRERSRSRSDMSLPPMPDKPTRTRAKRPRTRPRTRPFPDLESLPLPARPPAREVSAEPPLAPAASDPSPPVESSVPDHVTEWGPEEEVSGEEQAATSPPAVEEVSVAPAPPVAPHAEDTGDAIEALPVTAERGGRVRPKTNSRLVTPEQASRFYADAFRELEIMERDVLERGSWPAQRRRLETLAVEAEELLSALGPPARSGGQDFQAGLKKVERVQVYLERVTSLMEEGAPVVAEPEQSGLFDRIGDLFKRDDDA